MVKKIKSKIPKITPAHFILSILLLVLVFLTFEVIFEDKFFPTTFIGDTNITFLTKAQAQRLLDTKYQPRLKSKLNFSQDGNHIEIDLATSSASVSFLGTTEEVFSKGHQGTWLEKIIDQISLAFFTGVSEPEVKLSLDRQVDSLSKILHQSPKDAELVVDQINATSVVVKVVDGSVGRELDKAELERQIKNYIVFGSYQSLLPLKEIEPKITSQKASRAKQFVEAVGKEPIKLTFEGSVYIIDSKTLINLLDLATSQSLISKDKLLSYLTDLSQKINQPVIEGQFNFDSGTGRVSLFKPSQEGRELDIEKTATLITLALEGKRAKLITLPVTITKPKVSIDSINDLGIKELLGRGVSNFAGSIPNRIYNVNLTAAKMNGVLIAPGEVFSFNTTVGDVSAETGFKQAYVIKSGRTVLDDGGGVCQDSTTLFRAVLNAGLPVISRTAHAYRVSYYEQGFPPGLDATVFHPTVDFKFKNDTTAHILIQAYASGITLYVDLYGTSDGRVATISKSTITNQAPPPPELRQDDPTLPKGEVKQADWSAWGATVTFNRTVTRGGETLIKEAFRSVYKPWQAIYLVGTKEG